MMKFSLAKNVFARMTAMGFTISELEKKVGLRYTAIRSILKGHSKNPSAVILHNIANILHCHMRDILPMDKDLPVEDNFLKERTEKLDSLYEHHQLFMDTVAAFHQKLEEAGKEVTVRQYFACLEEIYLHSLVKDPSKVDMEYLDWFVGLIEKPA